MARGTNEERQALEDRRGIRNETNETAARLGRKLSFSNAQSSFDTCAFKKITIRARWHPSAAASLRNRCSNSPEDTCRQKANGFGFALGATTKLQGKSRTRSAGGRGAPTKHLRNGNRFDPESLFEFARRNLSPKGKWFWVCAWGNH